MDGWMDGQMDGWMGGMAWLEDTRTLKQNTLAYVRIFRKIEYVYDTFCTLDLDQSETQRKKMWYGPTDDMKLTLETE